jgi:hypothetical protein
MKKKTETWNQYLNNKNIRPKTFNLTVRRNRNGEFELLGGGAFMKNDMGGAHEWVQADVRDVVRSINQNGIFAK